MLRHNIVLFFRNIKKNQSSFLINTIGLSTGLACTLLIGLWVFDELRVDKFHKKDAQLYQVMQNFQFDDDIETEGRTPVPLGEALLAEMPEVEHAVAINDFFSWRSREGILSDGDNHIKAVGWHAGSDFFDVFSHKLLQGDKDEVLAGKNGIVLSQSLAKRVFGTQDNIIGKTLEWKHPSFEGAYQVTGVFENPPANATAQFDFLISMEILLEKDRWAKGWGSSYAETFLTLKKGTDVEQFNKKIEGFLNTKDNSDDNATLFVQQYSKKYLYGQYENGVPVGGRIAYVRLFSIIALFILLIACINFINLSTALASRKMKEIGIKKTVGANKGTLIVQFLGESMLMVVLSLVVAILFVVLFLPQFNEIAGKQLHLNMDFYQVLFIVGIVLLTGLVSGIYPAFYLSGFKTVTVLKGKFKTSLEEVWARKGLVIFQFALSIIFIIGLLVIDDQIKYTQTKNMGYDRDHIISFQWKGALYDQWNGLLEGKSNERFYVFMSELREVPGVVHATNMTGNILNEIYGQSGISWRGEDSDRDFLFQSPVVGYDFIETLGIALKEGRTFSGDYHDDYSKIILNEAAVKKMGLQDPVGQTIDMNGGSQIIGVVGDFHYGSLHNQVEPLIFRLDPHGRNIMVKIKAGTERATLERLEKFYQGFLAEYPFEFTFMDDDYQTLYESESRVAVLSKYFAGLAILISCLGLFGLATFNAERRRKEIGIRKVLGQSTAQVTMMLSGQFAKLVLVSVCVALPMAYILTNNWLSGFAYRIPLRAWYFLGAGLAALVVALLTVGSQAIQAANRNPVNALRDQ
ncbi:ABC transporter permease [Ulvibacterium sp.]|uniref:ABC transporter permease n=1 Tax=Ulvibacterium sp. TaxID=2665914 RepID=UPI00260D84E7|nr:ABC transporter permease [Ulvibacterium sp.]